MKTRPKSGDAAISLKPTKMTRSYEKLTPESGGFHSGFTVGNSLIKQFATSTVKISMRTLWTTRMPEKVRKMLSRGTSIKYSKFEVSGLFLLSDISTLSCYVISSSNLLTLCGGLYKILRQYARSYSPILSTFAPNPLSEFFAISSC
jgi:hypothetical protein